MALTCMPALRAQYSLHSGHRKCTIELIYSLSKNINSRYSLRYFFYHPAIYKHKIEITLRRILRIRCGAHHLYSLDAARTCTRAGQLSRGRRLTMAGRGGTLSTRKHRGTVYTHRSGGNFHYLAQIDVENANILKITKSLRYVPQQSLAWITTRAKLMANITEMSWKAWVAPPLTAGFLKALSPRAHGHVCAAPGRRSGGTCARAAHMLKSSIVT